MALVSLPWPCICLQKKMQLFNISSSWPISLLTVQEMISCLWHLKQKQRKHLLIQLCVLWHRPCHFFLLKWIPETIVGDFFGKQAFGIHNSTMRVKLVICTIWGPQICKIAQSGHFVVWDAVHFVERKNRGNFREREKIKLRGHIVSHFPHINLHKWQELTSFPPKIFGCVHWKVDKPEVPLLQIQPCIFTAVGETSALHVPTMSPLSHTSDSPNSADMQWRHGGQGFLSASARHH